MGVRSLWTNWKGTIRKSRVGRGGFDPFVPGGVASQHIAAGTLGILAGLYHVSVRPPHRLYKAARMGNIDTVLARSLAAVFFAASVVAGTMWYGAATTPIELSGPTRYQWDQGYFHFWCPEQLLTATPLRTRPIASDLSRRPSGLRKTR